jgi:hypothetical protein
MSNTASEATMKTATVVQVRESLVLIEVDDQTPLMKNEVGYVCVGDERLKAEVLRIRGRTADMQVFEDTNGVRVGDRVEMTGRNAVRHVGPRPVGTRLRRLQNPLAALAEAHGFFLPRGVAAPPLDAGRKWKFTPQVGRGRACRRAVCWASCPRARSPTRSSCPSANRNRSRSPGSAEGDLTLNDPVARFESSWRRTRSDHDPAVAGPPSRSRDGCSAAVSPSGCMPRAADDRHAHHRHFFPIARGDRLHSRSVRCGQDRAAEHHCPLLDRGRCRGRGLRRTGRRSRRDHHAVPGNERPAHRRNADGPHDHHLQHVVHAGRGPRGVDLHGDHVGRILSPNGLERAADRRFDVALGAGDARDLGTHGRNPGRRSLSGLPRFVVKSVYERAGVIRCPTARRAV